MRKIHPVKKGTEIIEKLVKLAYISTFLKDEKPLSLILIAPPEQSKSYYILKYKTKYSHISTDLSYMGLIRLLIKNKNLKQIVIPDFLKITQKGKNTKNACLTTLNSFLEEGIFNINLMGDDIISLNGKTGGIITSTTKSSFEQNKKVWDSLGFSSRFLIASWKYSDQKMEELVNIVLSENPKINSKNGKNDHQEILKYNVKTIKIDKKNSEKIGFLAKKSPRKAKNLRILAKSLALFNGRSEVSDEEILELKTINIYLNEQFTLINE
jgi:hypothetical protein